MIWEVDIARMLDIAGRGFVPGAAKMGTLCVRPAVDRLEAAQQVFLRQQLIQRLSKLMPSLMPPNRPTEADRTTVLVMTAAGIRQEDIARAPLARNSRSGIWRGQPGQTALVHTCRAESPPSSRSLDRPYRSPCPTRGLNGLGQQDRAERPPRFSGIHRG
jgi:hypothetical protein